MIRGGVGPLKGALGRPPDGPVHALGHPRISYIETDGGTTGWGRLKEKCCANPKNGLAIHAVPPQSTRQQRRVQVAAKPKKAPAKKAGKKTAKKSTKKATKKASKKK